MEPTQDLRTTRATLVDLLDRVLDKGLVIQADIIVSVAGIPLIGVNLRAALAGMETMQKYGLLKDWDESIRARAKIEKKELPLLPREEVILRTLGSYFWSRGIYTAWRPGHCYLTSERLVLYHQDFGEVIFQTPLEEIRGMAMKKEEFLSKEKREVIYLLLNNGEIAKLHVLNNLELKETLEKRMQELQLHFESNVALPEEKPKILEFLAPGEKITHQGKMWYLMPLPPFGKVSTDTWKPGHLYLTNKRLCWWYDFEEKIGFEVPTKNIIKTAMEQIEESTFSLPKKKILDLVYRTSKKRNVACFSGKVEEVKEWEEVLNKIKIGEVEAAQKSDGDREIETCPQCGQSALVKELLEKGCSKCGWVSPKKDYNLPTALPAKGGPLS